MTRETASERRARESEEARLKNEEWKNNLPMKVLRDMARAQRLGVKVEVVELAQNAEVIVKLTDDRGRDWSHSVTVGADSTPEWEYHLGWYLDSVQEIMDEAARLDQLRRDALAKLSAEERAALGV